MFLAAFKEMRDRNGSTNTKGIVVPKNCEIIHISYRTLIRVLNDAGYKFLKSYEANDKRKRVSYANNAIKKYKLNFWCIW